MNPSHSSEAQDDPGLEGPDYMTFVIEWSDADDAVTNVSSRPLDPSASSGSSMLVRRIATVVGALSAIALATWGIRRLRTAS
jgi:hypothetical protein